ncbi:MAG: galactose mutarotase [Lachnospiraceae bacterium]|nr:galactose mutarotase [Lachnospiraceae bacterium]
MGVTTKIFGTTQAGEKTTLYVMTNKNGMQVSVLDYGANIVDIIVPDKNGKLEDINLGYDTVAGYEKNGPGYGSFLGRVANRIAGAKFVVNGKTYEVTKNDGPNCLHSGLKSYNKYMYETEIFEENDSVTVEFSRLSPDMEQGFPGNMDLTISYTLTDANELVIEYFAVSDQDTVLNLTNHSYFNLKGQGNGTVLDHKAWINSDMITTTDENLIPTGEYTSVDGTPMDFRTMKTIGQDIEADYAPLKQGFGYDHNYVLKHEEEGAVEKVAELYEETTGRCMEVFTDLPGMQFYSANHIGEEKGKGGKIYHSRDAICFETQFYPNTLNIPTFPGGRLKAGEEFESVTVYKFSVK